MLRAINISCSLISGIAMDWSYSWFNAEKVAIILDIQILSYAVLI